MANKPLVWTPTNGSSNDLAAIGKAQAYLSGTEYDPSTFSYDQSAWAGSGGLKAQMYGNDKSYVSAGMTQTDMNNINKLAAMYDQQQTQKQIDAAIAPYAEKINQLGDIDTLYSNILSAQAQNYEAERAAKQKQIDQTVQSIEANKETINNESDKALREAYINNMLEKAGLNDYLQAMGYTGGMAETTAGRIESNYENNRSNAIAQRDEALRNNEELVAQAKVSGDSALVDMASDYMDNYVNTLQNQINTNLQVAEQQQNQDNLDREYQLKLAQYNDTLQGKADEENKELASQDFNTFLNTYQGKYTKKSTYEQWIKNLQGMEDPYGYNAQKIAYLRQYINSNFNGRSGTPSPAGPNDDGEGVEEVLTPETLFGEGTAVQNDTYRSLAAQTMLALNSSTGIVLNHQLDNILTQVETLLKNKGITQNQAQAIIDMMKG